MALRDQITFDETAPQLPEPTNNAIVPEASDPAEVEEMFNPSAPRLPQPSPMRVEVAEAAPPMPTRSDAVRNSGQQVPAEPAAEQSQPLVPEQDSRYQDPANVLIADVLMGGALPWVQAAADVAAGRVPSDQFDAARQEHQQRIQALREQHPEFISAAEQAAPFVAGLGISLGKPAASIGGALARGAAAATPIGAVQGYTGGPIEVPSFSGERVGNAVGRAAKTAVIGAAGAAAVRGTQAVKGALDQRSARKAAAAEEETQRVARETEEATAKRTRESAARAKAEEDELESLYKDAWSKRPHKDSISPQASENRKLFNQDPTSVYKWASKFDDPMDALSRATGYPPVVIAQRLKGKELPIDTPGEFKLYDQLNKVNKGRDVARKRMPEAPAKTEAPKPAPKGPETPPAAPPAAPPPAADAPKGPTRPRLPGKSLEEYEAGVKRTMETGKPLSRKPAEPAAKKPAEKPAKKPADKKPASKKPTKKEAQATSDFIETLVSAGRGAKEKERIRKRLQGLADRTKKDKK